MGRPHLKATIWMLLILLGIGIGAGGSLLLLFSGDVPDRNPPPAELADKLSFPGIPRAWMWGDASPPIVERWQRATKAEMREHYQSIMGVEHNYLAISGGAENGAFGAGLLCGWTANGSRPQFTMVSGVSTGALAAPFAFLGPEYDDVLKAMYTTYRTADLLKERNAIEAITSDGFASTAPLRKLIERYITQDVLDAVGAEYRKGRILLIGTTNFDANRPVLWRIGRIAVSDSPERLKLFHDVLIASASVPIAFSPVYIKAEAPDGTLYDEMHVDGSVTSQIFLYPLGIDWGEVLEKMEVLGSPNLYLINNGKLDPEWNAINPGKMLPIARRTLFSTIRTLSLGDLFRMYLGAARDGLEYRLAWVPVEFTAESKEFLDPDYMGQLFDLGYELAKSGYPWARHPPGYKADGE